MRYVGIDTKRVVRKGILIKDGQSKDFNALLGVSVSVNDPISFGEAYSKVMSAIFEKASFEIRRPVYKAKDLNQLFYPTSINPLDEFLKGIAPHVDALDVYYAYFLDRESGDDLKPFIDIYYAETTKRKKVSAIDFLHIVEESYPAYCALDHINQMAHVDIKIYVDHFKIRQCEAWKQIYSYKNLFITPWGDRCNYLISAADILASAIDDRLRRNNKRFKEAVEVLPEFESKVILNPSRNCIYLLSPAKDEFARMEEKIVRPVTYILPMDPKKFSEHYPKIDQKDMIIDSVIGDRLISEAVKNSTSIKFFDPTSDTNKIQKSDTFLYFDDYGKEKVNILQSFGFKDNRVIDARTI